MYKLKISLIMLLLVSMVVPALAAEEDLKEENAQLRQRVEKVEQELVDIKKGLTQKVKIPISGKNPVWAGLDVQLYGYIKADASYDTERTYPGNYALYLNSEATDKNDDEFNLTANQTRLGLKIKGPDSDNGLQTSGRLEFDFYGNYASENKAKIQMRHGYLVLDWPEDKFSVLAGQTSDVISPLCPSTLNYTVLWEAGNIGYRRPQIRLTKSIPMNGSSLKVEAAVARTIGRTVSGSETGEDSGFPTFQGRTSFTCPLFGYKPATVGFSGHWGQEEYDLSTGHKTLESWSLNVDLTQPVNEKLTIKGEYFHGVNLDNYLGGIGQGVDTTDASNPNEIASTGGWVAAALGPWDKWNFNVGAGIDDVKSNDVSTGYRTQNLCVFGNAIYSLNENTQIGLELSHWDTQYKGPGDVESLRAQMSFIYKF